MCATCLAAVTKLERAGFSEAYAMDVLWSETAFPFADGRIVMRQVREWMYAPRVKRLTVHGDRRAHPEVKP